MKLDPNNLEMASQTKIWRTWYATTQLPLEAIKAGFLDDCRDNGLSAPDCIELVAADGRATLLIDEIGAYGIGFTILEPRNPKASFKPARSPKVAKKGQGTTKEKRRTRRTGHGVRAERGRKKARVERRKHE